MNTFRSRIDPLGFFAPIEGLVILSLLYSPGPWMGTAGGYASHVVIWSMSLGIVLGTIAFINAVVGLISFKTHMWGVGLVGVVCLVFAAKLLGVSGSPKYVFGVYGVLLIAECAYAMARLKQARSRHEPTTLEGDPGKAPGIDRAA